MQHVNQQVFRCIVPKIQWEQEEMKHIQFYRHLFVMSIHFVYRKTGLTSHAVSVPSHLIVIRNHLIFMISLIL